MYSVKSNIILTIAVTIGLWVSLPISTMEKEQPQQAKQLNQLRLQRGSQQSQALNKRTLINLVAQLEEFQFLQQKSQQTVLTVQEKHKLQNLEQRLQKLTPQQYQEVEQKLRTQQDQWNKSKEIAMRQVLLDKRDKYINFLEKKLAGSHYQPQTLQVKVEELQTPIDLDLLEPSQELKDQANKIQKLPTVEQQAEQNKMQQKRLAQMQEQLKLLQSKDCTCCICFGDERVSIIPCKNPHVECICKECLGKIDTCPICREKF